MSGTVAECYCITHLRILILYNFICTVVQNFNEVDLKRESIGLIHVAQTMFSSSDFIILCGRWLSLFTRCRSIFLLNF